MNTLLKNKKLLISFCAAWVLEILRTILEMTAYSYRPIFLSVCGCVGLLCVFGAFAFSVAHARVPAIVCAALSLALQLFVYLYGNLPVSDDNLFHWAFARFGGSFLPVFIPMHLMPFLFSMAQRVFLLIYASRKIKHPAVWLVAGILAAIFSLYSAVLGLFVWSYSGTFGPSIMFYLPNLYGICNILAHLSCGAFLFFGFTSISSDPAATPEKLLRLKKAQPVSYLEIYKKEHNIK